MSEIERLAEVHRWLRYAREDLVAAEAMLVQEEVMPRHTCWLAQQSAEKALKDETRQTQRTAGYRLNH